MGIVEMISLGVGLAMDASAVSMANGFNTNCATKKKSFLIAFLFGLFQGLMPLIGYFIAHTILFEIVNKFSPVVALVVLGVVGVKMFIDGLKQEEDCNCSNLSFKVLLIQAIATSIDALSVGLVLASLRITTACLAALVISIVTFILSLISVYIGKKFGNVLQNKALLFGGVVLVVIGLFLFLKGII